MEGLPKAKQDDTDDVRWALETAHAVWAQGDQRGALSWVSRAAESAAEAGADMRAVELAKGAAELRAKIDGKGPVPPAAAPEPAAVSVPQARVRHHAVRVAVTLSPDHEGAFLAWPLKKGEPAPSNAHEALFVALDPDADLFTFKLE